MGISFTIFCSFPVTKTLQTAPHEDIAEENGDKIVGVKELDWSGRGGADKLKLCVAALDSLEALREGESHVWGNSVQECIAYIDDEFCVGFHANAGGTAEEQVVLLDYFSQCVEEDVATLLKFARLAFDFLYKIKSF